MLRKREGRGKEEMLNVSRDERNKEMGRGEDRRKK